MPRRRSFDDRRIAMSGVQVLLLMRKLDKIESKLDRVLIMERQMATKADFDAAMAALGDGITDLGTDVQAVLDKLSAGQQAGGLSQADLDSAVTTLTGVTDKIKTIDTGLEAAVAVAPSGPPADGSAAKPTG